MFLLLKIAFVLLIIAGIGYLLRGILEGIVVWLYHGAVQIILNVTGMVCLFLGITGIIGWLADRAEAAAPLVLLVIGILLLKFVRTGRFGESAEIIRAPCDGRRTPAAIPGKGEAERKGITPP
ncbi:MAG: hypothetical protein GDA53_08770 [Rhodobacteraceae bacterium]|nr:hypothetical protein [Paracoccaceae bacterium]